MWPSPRCRSVCGNLDVFVASRVLDILDKTLDVLLLAAWTYHQHVVGINHDVVLEAANDCCLILGYEDERVASVVSLYSLAV